MLDTTDYIYMHVHIYIYTHIHEHMYICTLCVCFIFTISSCVQDLHTAVRLKQGHSEKDVPIPSRVGLGGVLQLEHWEQAMHPRALVHHLGFLRHLPHFPRALKGTSTSILVSSRGPTLLKTLATLAQALLVNAKALSCGQDLLYS